MGLIKYIIYFFITLAHDPFFGKFFHSHITHIVVSLGTCFAFLEAGYLTGRLIKLGTYTDGTQYLIARFCRIYFPGFFVLFFSFLFMNDSVAFIHSKQNVFEIISKLPDLDKIVYYVSHAFILIQLYIHYLPMMKLLLR